MVTRPFVLDMETSDPDDFLTLLLLLGHPEVDLVAVTVTPGTREQVGIVRQALAWFGRDVPVGAWDIDHAGNCVSDWHYKAYPQLRVAPADADCPGWEVLEHVLGPDTTLVCGAALKNLGALLSQMGARVDRDPAWVPPKLGRAFVQGGFAGEGVVPPERQLEKFRGKVTCPTYNLNGDPASALSLLQRRAWFSDLRFVSKNVCHGVKYDMAMHARFEADRPT
jgi:pyrimidine-specific ribonucleoside hydrolase